MKEKKYDVSIVGGGPAGYFTALRLKELCPELSIAIFEKGDNRKRGDKNLLFGWGGAGTFSDGKLTLSPQVGGWLADFIEEKELMRLLNYVEDKYLEFDFPKDRVFGVEQQKIEKLKIKARQAKLILKPFKVRHAGTDGIYKVTQNIYHHLLNSGVEIYCNNSVAQISPISDGIKLTLENGQKSSASFVVLAPGRAGANWLRKEAERLGLKFVETEKVGVDLGLRVECPHEILQEVTDILHEFKIEKYTDCYEDYVRTFCVCPRGEVKVERMGNLSIINGYSYADFKKWSENTNFAILVKANFTYPFRDPIGYALDIVGLANKLGGGKPILQRLGDLRKGKRSKWKKISMVQPTLKEVEPGDLSYAIPERILANIREFLESLESLFPGLNDAHTLLYGVEAKLYSSRIETRKGFETMIDGLYAIGDGSGYTRSIPQAAASGLIAAESIAKKIKKKD